MNIIMFKNTMFQIFFCHHSSSNQKRTWVYG